MTKTRNQLLRKELLDVRTACVFGSLIVRDNNEWSAVYLLTD